MKKPTKQPGQVIILVIMYIFAITLLTTTTATIVTRYYASIARERAALQEQVYNDSLSSWEVVEEEKE